MSASFRMVMLVKASSILPASRLEWLDESPTPSIAPKRLCFATPQTKLWSSCCCSSGVVSQRKQPKQRRCLKIKRFSSKDATTSILDLKWLMTERKSVVLARSLHDEGPSLNRNEVVELLSDAVQTLLKPENQRRLRERLEKNKQRLNQQQSKLPEQPSNVDQWSSPAPINYLQGLQEVKDSEMEDETFNSGRCPSDQASTMTSVTNPITSQVTEMVKSERPPRSIENVESSTESIDSKEDSSLTGIRRLKVLDTHSYVHKALRESALRSWLHSRTIEE